MIVRYCCLPSPIRWIARGTISRSTSSSFHFACAEFYPRAFLLPSTGCSSYLRKQLNEIDYLEPGNGLFSSSSKLDHRIIYVDNQLTWGNSNLSIWSPANESTQTGFPGQRNNLHVKEATVYSGRPFSHDRFRFVKWRPWITLRRLCCYFILALCTSTSLDFSLVSRAGLQNQDSSSRDMQPFKFLVISRKLEKA